MANLIGSYRRFKVHATDEDIPAYWRERYGHEPEHIEHTGGGMLVGPVPIGAELRPGEVVVTGTFALLTRGDLDDDCPANCPGCLTVLDAEDDCPLTSSTPTVVGPVWIGEELRPGEHIVIGGIRED